MTVAEPKNGKGSKTEANPSTVSLAEENPQVELPKPQEPAKPKQALSVAEIEQRNEFLNTLLVKRMRIKESKLKIEKFRIGADSASMSVSFMDNEGNKFVTGNATAIEKMLKLVKDELTNSLIETETLITSVFE